MCIRDRRVPPEGSFIWSFSSKKDSRIASSSVKEEMVLSYERVLKHFTMKSFIIEETIYRKCQSLLGKCVQRTSQYLLCRESVETGKLKYFLCLNSFQMSPQRGLLCTLYLFYSQNEMFSTIFIYTSPSPRDRTRSRMPS